MEATKTWIEAHENEKFGDGGVKEQCKECKTCLFRDKTTVKGEEVGWYKCVCDIYKPPEDKPLEITNNTGQCEFYEAE